MCTGRPGAARPPAKRGGDAGAGITQEAAHSTHTVSDTVPVGEEEEENEVFCSASPAEIHLRQVQELEARDWSEEPQEVGRRISSGTVRAELSLLALDQQREEQGRTGRRGGGITKKNKSRRKFQRDFREISERDFREYPVRYRETREQKSSEGRERERE